MSEQKSKTFKLWLDKNHHVLAISAIIILYIIQITIYSNVYLGAYSSVLLFTLMLVMITPVIVGRRKWVSLGSVGIVLILSIVIFALKPAYSANDAIERLSSQGIKAISIGTMDSIDADGSKSKCYCIEAHNSQSSPITVYFDPHSGEYYIS